MRNITILSVILALAISCGQTKSELVEGYDDGLASTITEVGIPVLTIDDFDITAGQYVNKEIAISGIVDHVCKHSGKKLKLVTDGGSVHVDSETRFDDALVGNEIELKGIVRELRIDESYCLQMEEDNTKKHRSGEMNEMELGNQHKMIQQYRD